MVDDQIKQQILERYSKLGPIGRREVLECIPENERRYKCHSCFSIVDETPCPSCGETHLQILCLLDHCNCHHDVMTTHGYCPLCGEPVCPECGCHDVLAISRVTGYLQDTSGFNAGKAQELKDRTRYNIATGGLS